MSDSSETSQKQVLKADDVLSFKELGRPMDLQGVSDEMRLMKAQLKAPLTAEIATRICVKSGTHLLKLVSPRVDGDQACLYIEPRASNRRPKILPSTNAPDIPYCKVLYRPFEILGRPSRSIIDDVMNPDEVSDFMLGAFAYVFGQDVLDAIREALLSRSNTVNKLAAGEFPIIFVPRLGGGDLQITPVSPASAFMAVKAVINMLYESRKETGARIPRGSFLKQSVSSKPQNISGAIGGPRRRFMATMPVVMDQETAELHRYVRGGTFPHFRARDIDIWVLRYADMLAADSVYNDKNTRAALDRMADRLIREAQEFIEETVDEARTAANLAGIDVNSLPAPPRPAAMLIRRFRSKETFMQVRMALTSAHFEHREARAEQSLKAVVT